MKLQFTRNVLVYGEHRAQGTIHEIKDSDAVLLLADRAAVRAASDSIETAESRVMKAAEAAVITTAKGKASK